MTDLLQGFLSGSAAWGVLLTLAAFALGTLLNKATGMRIINHVHNLRTGLIAVYHINGLIDQIFNTGKSQIKRVNGTFQSLKQVDTHQATNTLFTTGL